jgi:hypothetical protein
MIAVPDEEAKNHWFRVHLNKNIFDNGTFVGNSKLRQSIAKWLADNLVYADWMWIGGTEFFFKNEDDATLFRLAWM